MKKILIYTIGILGFIYSVFVEPNRLVVNNYKISDSDLSGVKIVLLGDLHIKPNQEKRLKKIVDMVNEQNPDLILCVGDFVSGHELKSTLPIETICQNLRKLDAKVYTVLGNHDCWLDGKKVAFELEKNSIKVLANSNEIISINGKPITVAGVEDLQTGTPNVSDAIAGAKSPIILLTHSPDVFPSVPEGVNLTLAGHVHGGQVRLPFVGALIIPSAYGNRYSQGLIVENNRKMVVTKGIGTSILPMRFNCPPEIVVLEFE